MGKIVQCELRAVGKHVEETRIMVTWLEAEKNLRPGSLITLKDMENVIWTVETIGKPHSRSDIKRGWGMTDYFGKERDRK